MAEQQPAPGSATTPPAAPVAAPNPPPGEPSPKYVTQEQLDVALSERVQPLSDLVGGLRNDIRAALTKPAEPPAKPNEPQPKPAEPPASKGPEDPVLTERVKALETRETNYRESIRKSEVLSAAKAHGLQGQDAEDFTDLLLLKHGEQIVTDDAFRVTFKESETVSTEIGAYVGAYLQSAPGQRWKPAKAAPSGEGLQTGPNVDPNRFAGLTYKDVMSDPTTLRAMQLEAPEQLAQLRATADAERRKK